MSDPAPTPAPAPAPAPASTPPPEARHPQLANLMNSLMTAGNDAKPEKKEEPKPEPKAEPAKPVETKPEPKPDPIKVRKPKRPEIPVAKPAPIVVPTPVAQPREPLPDLEPEEKQLLSEMEELEKRFPDKHKGKAAAAERFLREHIKKVSAPDFDPEDADYQQWVKANRPAVSQRDLLDLHKAQVEESVKKTAEEKLNEVRHETYTREEAPKIKAEVSKIYTELANTVLPDEIMADLARLGKEMGPQKAFEEVQKTHKMEIDTAEEVLKAVSDDIQEFITLTRDTPSGRPLKAFDKNNPQHARLSAMVDNVCDQFRASGQNQQKDGKWFVTRNEWNSMPAEERSKFWTFDNPQIVREALKSVKPALAQRISARRAEMERYGFKRPSVSAPTTPATPVVPQGAPPAARPSTLPPTTSPAPSGLDPRVAGLMSNLNRN